MVPLPPNGFALLVGAAASLVRTAQDGPLRLVMLGVLVDVRPMIKPAQTKTAPMTLMMNALVPMVTPMFFYRPDVRLDADTRDPPWQICQVPPRRFGQPFVYPRTDEYNRLAHTFLTQFQQGSCRAIAKLRNGWAAHCMPEHPVRYRRAAWRGSYSVLPVTRRAWSRTLRAVPAKRFEDDHRAARPSGVGVRGAYRTLIRDAPSR
jgi:hypothetical protein